MTTIPKPPYRIPSMAEIAALPKNGLSLVSTFSGCGGSCLGYEMAGFKPGWASEFIPEARRTYLQNHPGVHVDDRDIRRVKPEEILERIGKKRGELDVLEGSPPCAAFSTAGDGKDSWEKMRKYSDTKQRTDDLFYEFARLVQGLQPRIFTAENVSGLAKGAAKGYFIAILKTLKSIGYAVEARLLDAQYLGVPQARQRVIFVGVRLDLGIAPRHPAPLPYRYSVADAISWRSVQGQHIEREADLSPYATGVEWEKVAVGSASDKYLNLVRPAPGGPCATICQAGGGSGSASVAHPFRKRKFSILELKRLSGFPDDFVLTGTYKQQWERLGRAVPPPMMKAVAETVKSLLGVQ